MSYIGFCVSVFIFSHLCKAAANSCPTAHYRQTWSLFALIFLDLEQWSTEDKWSWGQGTGKTDKGKQKSKSPNIHGGFPGARCHPNRYM